MITGQLLRDAFISGANHITNHKQEVDELNVFPVPDGDTGTNMSMTINAAARELERLESPTVSQAADKAAAALLRGARGNSGVILSLLFRGFSKGLKDKTTANGADIAEALASGVESAYKAVMKPTEGTILTVARVASEKAAELARQTNDPIEIFECILKTAEETLATTPEILPVLKKAGVVDAGGKGLVLIFEGMVSVMRGGKMISSEAVQEKKAEIVKGNAAAEFDGEITFTYCTEFIVNKAPDAKSPVALRAYLESIGDSAVVVDDDNIIKVHVHTDNPGNAIQEGLKYGYLTNMKIDNMREQHETKAYEAKQSAQENDYQPVDPEKAYGFVAVAAGQGLQALFTDLGVDKVVSGGQTMNPSTEDILSAIHATPAETVFVLPNNKNIIMAAEQAAKLADRRVCVLQTRTIPQGLTAMLAFDPDATYTDNRVNMTNAFAEVQTGQVTFAARDSDYDGHNIKQGEILGLENGKLAFTEKDITKAVYKLIKSLVKRDSSFVTMIYGADVSDAQAEKAYEAISAKLGDSVEINLINGGQPVYYYIVSVE